MENEFVLDCSDNEVRYPPVCMTCRHLTVEGIIARSCPAFEHIPEEIWVGDNPHTSPYPDDNGIRYEARN